MKAQLLIPAAGSGTRLGSDIPKALIDLGGKAMLVRTLEQFSSLGIVEDAVVLVPKGQCELFLQEICKTFPDTNIKCIEGGTERQESVSIGLEQLADDTGIVVIHDAARPFVAQSSVEDAIRAAEEIGAATVAVPCVDTILEADDEDCLVGTPDRSKLWACQTPQVFQVALIRKAHAAARRQAFLGTDDASLVRRMGGKVKLVMGTARNMKITTQEDLVLARALCSSTE